MSCPLFDPTEPLDSRGDPERPRPPLGRLWRGRCCAGEEAEPSPHGALDLCNFGYARGRCERLPRAAPDAVRFSIVSADSQSVSVRWLVERECLPEGAGTAVLDRGSERWSGIEPDSPLARQAAAYVRAYLDSDAAD